jgi:hypothetical protein
MAVASELGLDRQKRVDGDQRSVVRPQSISARDRSDEAERDQDYVRERYVEGRAGSDRAINGLLAFDGLEQIHADRNLFPIPICNRM